MSIKVSKSLKRPRRLKIPIEPIHVEELLGGAGMSGFLGILERPSRAASPRMSARVSSVVLKVEALKELIEGVNRQNEKEEGRS